MAETAALLGLCATCAKAEGCTFPRKRGVPVRRCEGFVGCDSSSRARPAREPRGRAAASPEGGAQEGLCARCANRETCTFPKPEGGVWDCEEYR